MYKKNNYNPPIYIENNTINSNLTNYTKLIVHYQYGIFMSRLTFVTWQMCTYICINESEQK